MAKVACNHDTSIPCVCSQFEHKMKHMVSHIPSGTSQSCFIPNTTSTRSIIYNIKFWFGRGTWKCQIHKWRHLHYMHRLRNAFDSIHCVCLHVIAQDLGYPRDTITLLVIRTLKHSPPFKVSVSLLPIPSTLVVAFSKGGTPRYI